MKRLQRKQKEILSDYFKAVALMAAAGLIFGQFVPGTEINWLTVVGGSLVSLALIIGAILISREKNHT